METLEIDELLMDHLSSELLYFHEDLHLITSRLSRSTHCIEIKVFKLPVIM